MTMSGIADLFRQSLGPVKDDIKELSSKFIEFSSNTTKDIDTLKGQILQVDQKLEIALSKAAAAETSVAELRAEFTTQFEDRSRTSRMKSDTGLVSHSSTTAVIGGLESASSVEAA